MLHTGLVSITFRKLDPSEIINLVSKAGLQAIEWGGDVHVPHGNVQQAQQVRGMTTEAGLEIAAYGSYYRVGCEGMEGIPHFEKVLETASELQAPAIRVWAGNRGSNEADEAWWQHVLEDAYRIADMAGRAGIAIDYEYHGNTLTDTSESACRLVNELDHPNIRSYWQPPVDQDVTSRIKGLEAMMPWLANVHVFHWQSRTRRPLREGKADWLEYLERIAELPGDRYALLEFVQNDDPEQFLRDAHVLKEMIHEIHGDHP